MDIQQLTDVNALKAMAYDQMVLKTLAENNLQLLQQRIIELEQSASAAATHASKPASVRRQKQESAQ